MINVVKQAISKDTCEVLSQSMELMRVMMGNPPDPTINNAFGYYSPAVSYTHLTLPTKA